MSVLAGTAVLGVMAVPALFPMEEGDLGPALTGLALLLVPYVLYAVAGRGLRPLTWALVLGLLTVSTVLGLLAARSSSTGGLVFLWLLPLQCALAWAATLLAPDAGVDPP